jgi:hypothetical protein
LQNNNWTFFGLVLSTSGKVTDVDLRRASLIVRLTILLMANLSLCRISGHLFRLTQLSQEFSALSVLIRSAGWSFGKRKSVGSGLTSFHWQTGWTDAREDMDRRNIHD